jgi:type II secretory pathway component GspD/PulD (secretin)
MTKSGAIRALVLGVFAAAGIGLAVSLAFTDVLRHDSSDGGSNANHQHRTPALDHTHLNSRRREIAQTSALLPDSPSQAAPTAPAVSEQTVDDLMSWLRDMSQQNRDVLDTAREMLRTQNQLPVQSSALPAPEPSATDDDQLPEPVDSEPDDSETTIRDEGDEGLTVNVREADLAEVLEELSVQTGMNVLAMPGATGKISASLNGVDANTALLQLTRIAGMVVYRENDFYYVGTSQEIEQLRRSHEQLRTRIYRPNYVTAAELQKLITPMLSQGGQATVSASAPAAAPTTSSQIATSSATKPGIAASTDQTGSDDFAGNEVLMVRDYESVLHYVDQIVAEVDQRPRQVALEAMILSVRLDDENSLGVNFELLRNEDNVRLITGSPVDDLATIDVSDGGLKFAFLDSNISTFISALETIGDTNVVASPRLMCLNKQRAEILIGSQLGYVNTTITETAATQSVEFLEVGTQLRFRPYIGSDGLIRLEVHPELSTGNVRIEQGVTLPDKDVTQVTTNIMCHDGCTVIIGGLIREDLTSNSSRVPVLGTLPWLGPLFRFKTDEIDRREIIVLLTPHIVCDPADYKEASQSKSEYLERQENFADKMSVIGRRHFGLYYLRLARAAWNAGDLPATLRFTNLSIHFDPFNREATVLHHQVLEAMPPGTDTIHGHLRQGLSVLDGPHVDYSHQGVPWQSTPLPEETLPGGFSPGESAPRQDLEPFSRSPARRLEQQSP